MVDASLDDDRVSCAVVVDRRYVERLARNERIRKRSNLVARRNTDLVRASIHRRDIALEKRNPIPNIRRHALGNHRCID